MVPGGVYAFERSEVRELAFGLAVLAVGAVVFLLAGVTRALAFLVCLALWLASR